MRVSHGQFKIRRLMMVVATAALALAPFAWSAPESRGLLLRTGLTVVTMLLILASPFLVDLFEGGRMRLKPHTKQTKPLPRLLQLFTWPNPPHKKEQRPDSGLEWMNRKMGQEPIIE